MISSFIIVFESFKEISGCFCPLTLCHVHFPSALMNYPHDPWMGYGWFYRKCFFVQLLQSILLSEQVQPAVITCRVCVWHGYTSSLWNIAFDIRTTINDQCVQTLYMWLNKVDCTGWSRLIHIHTCGSPYQKPKPFKLWIHLFTNNPALYSNKRDMHR